jgi:hypothetical protein
MSITEGKFWRQCDDYHDISKEFERNVQIVHPSYTKNYCHRSDWGHAYFNWPNTDIKYYSYRGENI